MIPGMRSASVASPVMNAAAMLAPSSCAIRPPVKASAGASRGVRPRDPSDTTQIVTPHTSTVPPSTRAERAESRVRSAAVRQPDVDIEERRHTLADHGDRDEQTKLPAQQRERAIKDFPGRERPQPVAG